jgi:hypothetical protein
MQERCLRCLRAMGFALSWAYKNIIIICIHLGSQHPPLHVARPGNILILFTRLNRVRRGQLERSWSVVVVVTPTSVGQYDSVAKTNRELPADWVSKPPDERSNYVENKAS